MERRTGLIIVGVVALLLVSVTLLSVVGLWFGYSFVQRQAGATLTERIADPTGWNRDAWPYGRGTGGPGMMWDRQDWPEGPAGRGYVGPGMMGGAENWDETLCGSADDLPCDGTWTGYGRGGYGMRGGAWENMPCGTLENMPCGGADVDSQDGGPPISLEEADAAIQDYLDRLGYAGLHVAEVMEFERNFYAIVAEEDTGIGAMELLVDRSSGAVGPEPGPNMMWNAKYGMHGGGRMGAFASGEMTVSPEEAGAIAQRWLDANLPGRTAGEADPFYGYYTLHFLNDGEIEGMLSVHGSSGEVWYHSWHGDFVAMTEGHD
jgi:hypothetical protein